MYSKQGARHTATSATVTRTARADELTALLDVGRNAHSIVNCECRHRPCPTSDPGNNVGLSRDGTNPNYGGSLPPFGATNYCITSAVQFYNPMLSPLGNNLPPTQHACEPPRNAPYRSCPCHHDATFPRRHAR